MARERNVSHCPNPVRPIPTPESPRFPPRPSITDLTGKITTPAFSPRTKDDIPRIAIILRPSCISALETQLDLREAIARIRNWRLQLGNIICEDGSIVDVRYGDGGRPRHGHGLSLIHRHECRCSHNVHGLSLRTRHVVDGCVPVDGSSQTANANAAN